jgi:hypothetical protein
MTNVPPSGLFEYTRRPIFVSASVPNRAYFLRLFNVGMSDCESIKQSRMNSMFSITTLRLYRFRAVIPNARNEWMTTMDMCLLPVTAVQNLNVVGLFVGYLII